MARLRSRVCASAQVPGNGVIIVRRDPFPSGPFWSVRIIIIKRGREHSPAQDSIRPPASWCAVIVFLW